MLKCPLCEETLSAQTPKGWQCACGELIPFGFEIDSEDSCETCTVMQCPRRKRAYTAPQNSVS